MLVSDLQDRQDLAFLSDSQDREWIVETLGEDAEEFDSFFIKVSEGEVVEAYGMSGIVPWLWKEVTRLRGEYEEV